MSRKTTEGCLGKTLRKYDFANMLGSDFAVCVLEGEFEKKPLKLDNIAVSSEKEVITEF